MSTPRMGGKALANQLKAMYPQLKVIFSSGYTNDSLAHQGVLMPGAYFIQKPFDREALSHSVRAALDAGDV